MYNNPVFTTKFVIESKAEIIYVTHDREGYWQFFSNQDASEQEARVVSMDEILEIDPSLEEILWIPEGTEAWREGVGKEWVTKVYSE
ncbi:MAG: hypothetical protein RIR12_888 [Bacteroidota bacterium]|jgi:hypothetical protein